MKKRKNAMLTLSDINRITNSHDGDVYSDLYKEVYGCRPRHAQFNSVEAFDADFESLSKKLSIQIEIEKQEKAQNWVEFLSRIEATKQLVTNADTIRAVEIIAEAEGIDAEERSFYGWERLEWKLGLNYGSIKLFLAAETQNAAFLEETV